VRTKLAVLVCVAWVVACGDAAADERAETQTAPATPVGPTPVEAERGAAVRAAPTRAGEWIDLGHFGDRRHRPRDVRAWVPDHEEGARLPVLVVLDGQGSETWFRVPQTIAALVDEGRIEPWIVLAVDSTADRTCELGRTDGRFGRFLEEVVLPAARDRLPIRERRASTAILGYSYGGLAAVAAGVGAADTFGRVIAMSASLWVDQRAVIARFEGTRTLPLRLWIDVGSREPDAEDLIPYMVGDARDLRDVALGRGMVFGRDVGFDEALGEGHDMSAAGRRMRAALLFALGDRDLSRETPTELSITRYPAHGRRATHAIGAAYEGGAHLTFPEQLVEVRAGDTVLTRDIAHLDRPLSVRACGPEARCE
jgi:predicted alpha/beta superfamily hydrolase